MVTAVSTVLTPKTAQQGGSRSAGPRRPLLPSDSENAAAPRRPKGRDVSSRYMSSLSASSLSSPAVKRSASPLISRTAASTPSPPASAAAMKRSQSVERRQVASPPPNLLDLRTVYGLNGRETATQKVLFTSVRSLAVSFQGRSFSLQVSKTKPSPAPSSVRRGTPERRKPAANYASYGPECADRSSKFAGCTGNVTRTLNDTMMQVSLNSNNPDLVKAMETERNPVLRSDLQSEAFMDSDSESVTGSSDNTPKLSKKSGFESPLSSPKGALNSVRHPSPAHRAVWPASPSKLAAPAASTPTRNATMSMPSILCFAADLRSGRIGENRVANAHELRLMYDRLLQWRFVNARSDSSLRAQESDALRSLSSARFIISKMRNSVKWKRMELQSQRHKLKLASILLWQMVSLEAWDSMDRDYSDSLSGAVEALEASTLRLPVVAGARVEIQKVKDAVCSAADVMQAVLSSTCFLSTEVEEVNSVVLELIHAAAKESALLNQSRDLLSTIAAMQVMECSLRTHILQLTPLAPSKFTHTSIGIVSD